MKPPFWKILLSYLREVPIESVTSSFHDNLHVILTQGRYQLCTDQAIYSFEDLYDNFYLAFKNLDTNQLKEGEALLLGLGLASVPLMLEKYFKKKYNYTAIEVDEAVIYLASKYALPYLRSPIQVIYTDAQIFVEQCRQTFDLIIVDIFEDDLIPPVFQEAGFLLQVKELLSPGGLLMYNRLALTDEDKMLTSRFFYRVFRVVFPEAVYLEEEGSWMLLSREFTQR